jgi:hypothetical protein
MITILAQGDILFECLSPFPSASRHSRTEQLVAEGELTGHSHRVRGLVNFFRDDGLARDIPNDLYVGHLSVKRTKAEVLHEEHLPLTLQPGVWRIRRQRQMDPQDVAAIAD